ncbi:MAG: ABC transporter ATP-binding protein [Gemmatimonadaceae bacterium]|nr:ABC transporter ATP-binding protein [Gemmatimonadaceae bacterium]
MAAAPIATLRGVTRRYETGSGAFDALSDVTLAIGGGQFTVVIGESGSGKSTLLGLLAGIDRPSAGRVQVGATDLTGLSERELSRWRGRALGLVFQFFQLLPTLSVCENVMLPMDFCGSYPARERRARALTLLEQLGIADQADKLPSRLSGGQQQRAAVARALANDPPLLLADEPTGNLDSRTSSTMLELLAGLSRAGRSIVMVTHDARAMSRADRAITLEDGRVVADTKPIDV